MLNINCLLNNPEIQDNLRDIIEMAGYELAAATGRASLGQVFNVMRRSGVEIDIQTLSHLYEDIFDTSDPAFSDDEELFNARQETYRQMAAKTVQYKIKTIGTDKPSVAAAENIVNTLIKNIYDKTQQKIMEERLTKAAKRFLNIKSTQEEKTLEELLREVLSTEQDNDFYGLGIMENAQTLFRELADELAQEGFNYDNAMLQQYGEILQNTTLDFLASTGEIKKMVDGTLKDAGYIKDIQVKGVTRQVVDWDKIIKDNVDFKAALKALFVKKGISDKNSDNLVNGLEKHYQDMLAQKIATRLNQKNRAASKPKVIHQKKNIDRLVNLYNLGIFENAEQGALIKMLGIPQIKQQQLKQVRQVMSAYQSIMHGTSMAKWSPTVIRTFQRQVDAMVASFENREMALNVMSKISAYMQWSNAAILVNPQNVAENIISGFIESQVVTTVINPAGFGQGLSDLWDKFIDFVKGGVRVGEEKLNAFNRGGGNIEDIYNRETQGLGRPDVLLALIPRVALGAADNAFKHSMVQSLIQKSLYQLLVKQGATSGEANLILNKIYYGNNVEIERFAKAYTGAMVSAGVHTRSSVRGQRLNEKEKIIASELALANMMTEGRFFQDTINDMIANGELSNAFSKKLRINEEMLFAIRAAAYSTAAKGLGHEADNVLLKVFETRYDVLNAKIERAKKNANYGDYAIQMSLKLFLSGINKFRSGGFNWMWLAIEKSTGLALAQTLITDVALGKTRGIPLRFSQIDFSNLPTLETRLSKYMALRQRLVRETIPVLFSFAIAGASLLYIGGGGDDEEKRRRMKEFKIYLDTHPAVRRWVNKIAPSLLYTFLSNIHGVKMDEFPVLTPESAQTLRNNDIYDVSNENLGKIKAVLKLTDSQMRSIQAKLTAVNNQVLPGLLGAYLNPLYQAEAQKYNVQPNPAIQWSVDMFDKTKPDKGAVSGQATGTILNFGGALQSYDIWKNSIKNPAKIPGEWKLIQPEGFGEGMMFRTLNKDLYKTLFVSDADLQQRPFDLPHIGSVKVAKLAEHGISEVTMRNLAQVKDILELSEKQVIDIRNSIRYHKQETEKIMGK